MRLERYQLKTNKAYETFSFISEGPRGNIEKRIIYSKMQNYDVFNLAFGDKIKGSQEIDDSAVTDNKDSEKVLATVAASVYVFTEKYPDTWVFLTGSTNSRTRLYRMGISIYFEELSQDFNIYGRLNNEWIDFEKDTAYTAFLIKRK